MTRQYRPWTWRDDELLEKHLGHGIGLTEIAKRMKRARQVVARKRDELFGTRPQHRVVIDADFRIEIPDEVLADRDRRLGLHARDLTASLMGDPPVGMSALERRA